MLPFCELAFRSGLSIFVAAFLTVAACTASPSMADEVTGSWLSIKSAATGKYLTCEAQRGVVDCDGTDVPTSQTWWLSQWELVHVGGPKPPQRYRLHEIAVVSPEYCSDVAGEWTT